MCAAAFAAAETFVEFEGSCLLEQIDHCLRIGTQRHPDTGSGELTRRSDAVAKIAFRGRTHRHGAAGRGEQREHRRR